MKILNRKQKKIQVSNTDLRDGDLERLLLRQRNSNQKDLLPSSIRITQGAKEKAFSIGPAVKRIGNSAYEWYGFLLGNIEDSQHIIREIILAQDQDVSGGHVQVEGVNVARANQEVKEINKVRGKNYQIIGWTHNHANFSTFHSGTDDNNHLAVLNSVSLNTEKGLQRRFALIERNAKQKLLDDRIVVNGEEITDGSIEYLLNDENAAIELLKKYGVSLDGNNPRKLALELLNDILKVSRVDINEPKIYGFAYSIVFNNKGDNPHSEIAIIEEEVFTKKKKVSSKEIPLSVVEIPDDIEINLEDIQSEIKNKIKFPVIHKPVTREVTITYEDFVPTEVGTQPTRNKRFKKYDKPKKEARKKISYRELSNMFARDLLEYLDNYSRTDCRFSRYVEDIVDKMIVEGKSLTDCIKSLGVADVDEYGRKPDFEKSILELITNGAYADIKEDKENRKKVIRFMLDFVNSNRTEEKSDVIGEYVPIILGVDNNLIDFCRRSLSYAINPKRGSKYNVWVSLVLKNFAEKDRTLEESIALVGKLQDNETIVKDRTLDYWAIKIDYGQLKKIRSKIYLGKYEGSTLEFMIAFNDPNTRDAALRDYSDKILDDLSKEEKREIDDLIKDKEKKPDK